MIKSELALKSKIFNAAARKSSLKSAVTKSGEDLVSDVKGNMTNSIPRGEAFRKKRITSARSGREQSLGFKRTVEKNGKRGWIAVHHFRQRSKKEQPPAVQTGRLKESVVLREVGPLSVRVSVEADYGARLDDPHKLDRPFFRSRVKRFKSRFLRNVAGAVEDLI